MTIVFGIVTPTFNSEDYLRETIASVLTQKGNFRINYYIVDGGSSDGTLDIIRQFASLIDSGAYPINCLGVELRWSSAPDQGMYDAINQGFARCAGDVCAWINSDDIYLPGAFGIVADVFEQYPEIEWIKGISSYINERSEITKIGLCNLYARELIRKGVYGRSSYFIQQDSVFWRSDLWRKVGGVETNYRLAGDYHLWRAFSAVSSLISVDAYLSCFRKAEKQLSSDMAAYMNEAGIPTSDERQEDERVLRYARMERRLPNFLKPMVHNFLWKNLRYSVVTRDAAGVLELHSGNYYDIMKRLKK